MLKSNLKMIVCPRSTVKIDPVSNKRHRSAPHLSDQVQNYLKRN